MPFSILLLPFQHRLIPMVSPRHTAKTGHSDLRARAPGYLPCFYSHCSLWQARGMDYTPKQKAGSLQVSAAPHCQGTMLPRLSYEKQTSPHSPWICSCCTSIVWQAYILLNEKASWKAICMMLSHYWKKICLHIPEKNVWRIEMKLLIKTTSVQWD